MRKILFLFIFCFLLTGCTAEYSIKLDDSYVEENLDILGITESFDSMDESISQIPIFYSIYSNGIYQSNTIFYNYNINVNNINYNYKFDIDYYDDSTILSYVNFIHNDNNYNATNFCTVFEDNKTLDEIKIKVQSSRELVGNYKSNKNNSYLWNIKRNNCMNEVVDFYVVTEKIEINDNYNTMLIAGIGTLLLIIILIIYNRIKKSNN